MFVGIPWIWGGREYDISKYWYGLKTPILELLSLGTIIVKCLEYQII